MESDQKSNYVHDWEMEFTFSDEDKVVGYCFEVENEAMEDEGNGNNASVDLFCSAYGIRGTMAAEVPNYLAFSLLPFRLSCGSFNLRFSSTKKYVPSSKLLASFTF